LGKKIVSLFIILSLVSCARIDANRDLDSASEPQPDPVDVKVQSEKVEIDAQTPEGNRLWKIHAAQGEGSISEGAGSGNLLQIEATVYQDDKEFLYLTADTGSADEKAGTLSLNGNVDIHSADRRTRLQCDRIIWNQNEHSLKAWDIVAVQQDGTHLGPATKASAKFVPRKQNMNTGVVALTISFLTMQGAEISYRDRDGLFTVTGMSQWTAEQKPDDMILFEAIGKPLLATLTRDRLEIRGEKLTANLKSTGSGETRRAQLVSATLKGSVSATMSGQGDPGTLNGLSELSMTSINESTWKFEGAGALIKLSLPERGFELTGKVLEGIVERIGSGNRTGIQWMRIRLSQGTKAILRGKDREQNAWEAEVHCPTMTLDRTTRKLTLTGGVKIIGNHPMLGGGGGEVNSPRITVTFDSEMRNPIKIEAESGG
jgi:LPS export ABC transporter protein LptC